MIQIHAITEKAPAMGHNSGLTKADMEKQPHRKVIKAAISGDAKDVGGVAGVRLRSFIERVETLEGEKAALAEDIKEIFAEAKGTGFDVKTIRKIIAERKIDIEKRREAYELLDLYKTAIGMN